MLQEGIRTLTPVFLVSALIHQLTPVDIYDEYGRIKMLALNIGEICIPLSHRLNIIYFSRLRTFPFPSNIELKAIRVAQVGQLFSDHYSKKAYQRIGYKVVILQNPFHMNHRTHIGRDVPFILRGSFLKSRKVLNIN